MSELEWQWPFDEDEALVWQGRPAPRCYTFRNWKAAALATILFLASSFWMLLGYQLIKADGQPWWLLLIPLPLVVLSFWFGPLSLLLKRIRWEKEFYALTDKRLLVRDGLLAAQIDSFPLSDVLDWQQKSYSEQLLSLRVHVRNHKPVFLYCLEQPQNLLNQLHQECRPLEQRDSV